MDSNPSTPAAGMPAVNLLAGSLVATLIVRAGRIVEANIAAARLFEAGTPAALLRLAPERLLTDAHLAALCAAAERGETVPQRLRVQTLAGASRSAEVLATRVEWPGGAALQVSLRDRSELERAEAQVRETEAAFQDIIGGSLQGIYVHDRHRFLFVNEAFATMFGYRSPAEVLAMGDVLQCYTPAERKRLLGFYEQRIGGGQPPVRYEFQGQRRDGGTFWLENLVRVVKWRGQPAILATVIDITERKHAEQELLASEQKYRDLIDGSMQAVAVVDESLHALFVNPTFVSLFGFDTAEEVYALDNMMDLVVAGQRDALEEQTRARLAGEPVPTRYSAQGLRRDGSEVQMETAASRIQWEGRPAIQIAMIDITERERAQRELEDHRRLLQAVFDTIPHFAYVKDSDLRYRMANRAFCARFGLEPEAVPGLRVDEVGIVDASVMARIEAADREVLRTGKPQSLHDVQERDANGRLIYLRMIKFPLRDDQGRVNGLVGITEDVTEQREAERGVRDRERLLRTIIDTIPHGIYVKDRDLRYRVVNAATAQFYGGDEAQVLGRTLHELVPDWTPQLELMHRSDEAVLREGLAHELPDLPTPDAKGAYRMWHIVKVPLPDEQGGIDGVLGVAEDITERKGVEEELRSSRALLQTVFDLIPLWVFVKDTQRRFMMINRKMAEDYALVDEMALGAQIDLGTTLTEEERSVIYDLDQRVLDSGELIEVPEVQITLPRLGPRLFRTVRVPLSDAVGAVAGIVGISEDITERRRTEQTIQQAQKLESLGVLAGGIAHDFNNLLVSILGNASLALLDLPPGAPAQVAVAQIETAGQRAAELCRQMLAYSGKGSFEIAVVGLNQLIEEMTQLLHVSLARSITLRYEFDPNLPTVEVDPTQIRQVVMNLVMNAAEAIGERVGTIRVATSVVNADPELLRHYIQGDQLAAGTYVCLEVEDTGVGIPPEMVGRIFDPFFTTKFAGRGLGLAAVLGIAHGHSGAMQVISDVEAGSIFRMLLPTQGSVAETVPPADPSPPWRGEGAALVVAPEGDLRTMLQRMLDSLGLHPHLIADGHAAPEAVRRIGAALRIAVLDASALTAADAESLAALRASRPALPVLVVSDYGEQDVCARLPGVAPRAVLQLPFTLQGLAARLRELLG